MNEMESVDITADEIAAAVMATIHTSDDVAAMRTFKEAAERLDYRFVTQWNPERLPEAALDVLGDALDKPNDVAAGRLIAGLIVSQLADHGIYMQMGTATANLIRAEQYRRGAKSAAQSTPANDAYLTSSVEVMPPLPSHASEKRNPTCLVVEVADDQVVVSGPGTLATYNWRAKGYDSRVARLSMQPTRQVMGSAEEDTYRVVAGDTDGQYRTRQEIVADNLSHAEALELIAKIQSAIHASLGIDAEPAFDTLETTDAQADPMRPRRLHKLAGRVASMISLLVTSCIYAVLGVAIVGVAMFLFPIAYRIGRHVGISLIDLTISAHPGLLGLLS